jgi:hypothetical protein
MTVSTISVVIPAYKCAAFLPEAIESAMAQGGLAVVRLHRREEKMSDGKNWPQNAL